MITPPSHLNDLLECAVDRRADVGHVLPEINSGNGALRDTLGGEFELLFSSVSIQTLKDWNVSNLPCRHPCRHQKHQTGSSQIARVYTAPSPLCS